MKFLSWSIVGTPPTSNEIVQLDLGSKAITIALAHIGRIQKTGSNALEPRLGVKPTKVLTGITGTSNNRLNPKRDMASSRLL